MNLKSNTKSRSNQCGQYNQIKLNNKKKIVNYRIDEHTIDRFKVVADKDMRRM